MLRCWCVLVASLFLILCKNGCIVDRRDQKTLEKLRAERLAKINELKERTNYYTTQQLIQVRLLVLRTQRICGNSVYDKY